MSDRLFSPDYADPVDTTTCVERIPGTPDAPCHCGRDRCRWPFDPDCWPDHHPQPEKETEAA